MLNLGDVCRLRSAPKAPPLTVASLYLQGDPEELWAACSWSVPGSKTAKPAPVHFRVAELVGRDGAAGEVAG